MSPGVLERDAMAIGSAETASGAVSAVLPGKTGLLIRKYPERLTMKVLSAENFVFDLGRRIDPSTPQQTYPQECP